MCQCTRHRQSRVQPPPTLEDPRRVDAFFGAAPVRNPQTEARFASKIQELRQLQFVSLIVENPAPGMLLKAATRSRGSLLTVYHDSMIQRLLAARKKGALDFEFLSRAWECKTMDAGSLQGGRPSVRPVMGALFNCNQATLHGVFCSDEPVIQQFADRLLIVKLTRSRSPCSAAPGALALVQESLQKLLARLMGSLERRLILSGEAWTRLLDFANAVDGLQSSQGRIGKHVVMVACKIALILHVWTADPAREISETTLRTAIALAKRFVRESVAAANCCAAAHPSTAAEKEEAYMLAKLLDGALEQRDLQKSYHDISVEDLVPILDRLIQKGLARRREDGLIEAVDSGGVLS